MMKPALLGIFLAILAALWNASVGVLSKGIFNSNLSPISIAFYKCLFAFLILSTIILLDKGKLRETISLTKDVWKLAICSFFGIFVLYLFETKAYGYESISVVVFALLGSSTITTFLFSSYVLKEKKGVSQAISLVCALSGLGIMFWTTDARGQVLGLLLACIAGSGYGLFLVFAKKFGQAGTLSSLWWLMGFGCLYLSVPFICSAPVLPATETLPSLLALSVIPTIGGFYCTNKALTLIDASKVQLFELTEPIFATALGFILLGEVIYLKDAVGGALIISSIFIYETNFAVKLVPVGANINE